MANILSADVYDEGDSNLRPESRRIEDTGALFTSSQTATSYCEASSTRRASILERIRFVYLVAILHHLYRYAEDKYGSQTICFIMEKMSSK